MANIHEHVNYIFEELLSYSCCENPEEKKSKMQPAEGRNEDIDLFRSYTGFKKAEVLPGFTVASFNSNNTRYVAANISSSEIDFKHDIFSDVDVYSAEEPEFLYCAKLLSLKVSSKFTKDTILNDLLSQQDDETYSGHDLLEVSRFFEDVSIFRIEQDHILFDKDIENISYLLTTQISKLIPLPISTIIDEYVSCIGNTHNSFINNVFMSLTSTHWKHAFLELYRCIEGLYVMPSAICLKNAIGYTGKAADLAEHCITSLDWRRKEEASLGKIVDVCMSDQGFVNKLNTTGYLNAIEEKTPKKVAKRLYKLRNINVHQAKEVIELSDVDWRELLSLFLVAVELLHQEYQTEL